MKNKLTCASLLWFSLISVQAQIGFEQYCYVENKQMTTFVPMFTYESNSNWYAEGRYNYEELNTFSLYVGRSFTKTGTFTYSVIPILGGVFGKFNGLSSGVNGVIEFGDLFFNTQSQYTVSFHDRSADFLFAWSELGYQPWKWFYLGITAQQTYQPQINVLDSEPGMVIGFNLGMWTFPLYVFNPMRSDNYYVLGINLSVDGLKKNK